MTDTEWKTVRVRKDAWEQAQEQRQDTGRTWSEQIVRGTDPGRLTEDDVRRIVREELTGVIPKEDQ